MKKSSKSSIRDIQLLRQKLSKPELYDFSVSLQDDKKPLESIRRLADQGDTEFQYYLGVVYFYGVGVDRNYSKAFKCFQIPAAKGHVKSLFCLGYMYLYSLGVDEDYAEAFKCFQIPVHQGHAESIR